MGNFLEYTPNKIYKRLQREIEERSEKIRNYLSYSLGNNLSFNSHNLKKAMWWYFRSTGKLLRPLFYSFGCDEIKEKYYEDVHLNNACALEMIHVSTLVHDDLIDNANIRRGLPAVHHKFGNDIAILSGDALFAYALSLTNAPKDLASLYRKICDGQALEIEVSKRILEEESIHPQEIYDAYLKIISLKTAEFFAVAFSLPAKIKGSSKKSEVLYHIGKQIGIAFQIADDISDLIYRDKIKEDFASDLNENKPTILYVLAKQENIDILKIYKHRYLEKSKNISNILEEREGLLVKAHVDAALEVYELLKNKGIIDKAISLMEHYLMVAERDIHKINNKNTQIFLRYISKKIKNLI